MPQQSKRAAQEALFAAIQDQAETNMKSALRAPEKARLLLELAQAYRLTAGGSVPAAAAGKPSDEAAGNSTPASDGARKRTPAR